LRVLLVYLEFPDTFWSFKHALKLVCKRAGAPPLELLTVAAMLPSDWEPRLVDLNVQSLCARTWPGPRSFSSAPRASSGTLFIFQPLVAKREDAYQKE
jgi:hypothetical protein